MHKTRDFLRLYEQFFEKYKERSTKILEIGVQFGGFISYLRTNYPHWDVWGLDVDTAQINMLDNNKKNIIKGSQDDVALLETLPDFDIIIDDGGHTMHQQQTSFETLFPRLKEGGLYVIEDLHTSYWPKFQDRSKNTMDFLKDLTDGLNWEANNPERLGGNRGTENKYKITGIHFYPSICFIEK